MPAFCIEIWNIYQKSWKNGEKNTLRLMSYYLVCLGLESIYFAVFILRIFMKTMKKTEKSSLSWAASFIRIHRRKLVGGWGLGGGGGGAFKLIIKIQKFQFCMTDDLPVYPSRTGGHTTLSIFLGTIQKLYVCSSKVNMMCLECSCAICLVLAWE